MYYSDKPIEDFEEDLLGRSSFARQLADSILSIDLTDSFAIGICGKWGTGKTSVLNMMQKEIDSKGKNEDGSPKAIVMRFEPWNFSTCDQLLAQFFAQMIETVSIDVADESLRKVGTALERYSSGLDLLSLVPIAGTYLKVIPAIAKALGANIKDAAEKRAENISAKKQLVVNALRDQNCKIVVVIDDIDRLSNDQIRLIFQLVSSVAGFPRVIYVLSFDKDIVARALQTVQSDNGLDYIEKIIQVPFDLPEIDMAKVQNVLLNRLNKLLRQYPEIQVDSNYWSLVYLRCISPFISTLRDVNRIVNALSLKVALLKNEVNFCDLVAITVFQVMQPRIYDWIQRNKKTLVGTSDFSEAFAMGFNQHKKTEEEYIQELSGDNKTVGKAAFDALVTLFPGFGSLANSHHIGAIDDDLRRNRRIAHIDKFDLYTSLSLEKIPFSAELIHSAFFDYTEQEFSALLINENERQKAADFLTELRSWIPELPQERIPVLIKSLLSISCRLTGARSTTGLSLQADTLAVYDIELLLTAIPKESFREELLVGILLDCSEDSLYCFADILNGMELSHGRLAAKGNKHGDIIVSLEGLVQLEKAFMKRISALFVETGNNTLQWPYARMLYYLWSCFDSDSYAQHLTILFKEPENICRYIAMFASVPTVIAGKSDQKWVFSADYLESITDERALETLNGMLTDRSFFNMDPALQIIMAAYSMWCCTEKKNAFDGPTEGEAENQLRKWTSEYL